MPCCHVTRGCGTTTTSEEIVVNEAIFTEFRTSRAKALQLAAEDAPAELGPPAPISVVWHVVYKNETLEGGYLPEYSVNDSISAMNDHYKSVFRPHLIHGCFVRLHH